MGMALLFITHDLGIVAASRRPRRASCGSGEIVETGPNGGDILRRPQADYTAMLLGAEPTWPQDPPRRSSRAPIIDAGRQSVEGPTTGSRPWLPCRNRDPVNTLRAVDNASRIALHEGARRSALSANPARANRRSAWRCCG
jgi:ABC-type microcin C transport system duplicated ATPase subunit YejF